MKLIEFNRLFEPETFELIFFSQIVQYFVSQQGELEERVLFLHAEYTLSFFSHFYTIHKETEKRKG